MTIDNNYSELELQFKQAVKTYRPQLDKIQDEIAALYLELDKKTKELQLSFDENLTNLENKAAALSEECGLQFYYFANLNTMENCTSEYTPQTFKKWNMVPHELRDDLNEHYPVYAGWHHSTIC